MCIFKFLVHVIKNKSNVVHLIHFRYITLKTKNFYLYVFLRRRIRIFFQTFKNIFLNFKFENQINASINIHEETHFKDFIIPLKNMIAFLYSFANNELTKTHLSLSLFTFYTDFN